MKQYYSSFNNFFYYHLSLQKIKCEDVFMKTKIATILVILILFNKMSAQINEYFPLKIGAKFKYGCHQTDGNYSIGIGGSSFYSTGDGYIFYTVIDSIVQNDSLIIWSVEQSDSIFIRTEGSDVEPDSGWSTNTNIFQLIELKTGNHKIKSADMSAWYFMPTLFSEGLFRFYDRSEDTISVLIVNDDAVTGAYYYLKKNVGLVKWSIDKSWNGHTGGYIYTRAYQLVTSTTLNVQTANRQPNSFYLHQNYPNPFNSSTVITYSILKSSFVSLKIYNSLGQEIATLIKSYQSAGNYSMVWDASNISSGIYFYRMQADNYSDTRKMVLTR